MATFIPPGCLDCVVPQFLASFSWLCLELACVCQQMLLSGEALELFLSLGEISLRCSDYTGWQQPGDILEAAFTILFSEVLVLAAASLAERRRSRATQAVGFERGGMRF